MTWTVEQVTDGRGRRYVIRDEAGEKLTLPSVTTILGSIPKGDGLTWWGFKLGVQAMLHHISTQDPDTYDLDYWYAACKTTDYAPHKALKAAGGRGTAVHLIGENLMKYGRLDELPAGSGASDGYVDALVKFHSDYDVASWEVVEVEALLFSEEHRYAGQCDLIAKRPDGVYVVADWKTSKGIYESHTIQAAAYEHAAREMGLIPTDAKAENLVVRLGDDGQYEVVRSRHGIEDFLVVKAMYEMLKSKDKKGVKL